MKQEAVLIDRKNVADTLRINPSEFVPLPELFEDICKLKTKEEKNNLINVYISTNPTNKELLKNYIQSVYHPMVILDLPPEVPPYTSDFPDYEMTPTPLNKALLRIKHFVKGNPSYIENKIKREEIFIRTLEQMYKDNSELYTYILTKEIDNKKYPGLNDTFFFELFPEWFPENYQPKKNQEKELTKPKE
jgi:hypothetical protein